MTNTGNEIPQMFRDMQRRIEKRQRDSDRFWAGVRALLREGKHVHINNLLAAIAQYGVPVEMGAYVARRWAKLEGPGRGKPKGTRHGKLPAPAVLRVEYGPLLKKYGWVAATWKLAHKYDSKFAQIRKRLAQK